MFDNQYFKKYLKDKNIDLSEHLEISKHCRLELDQKTFENFVKENRDKAVVKSWHPRPFLSAMGNEQAINANWIGYNKHNTTETNWGLDPLHNEKLKDILGQNNFQKLGIDMDRSLVRLLEYLPGQCLPLHSDGLEGFKNLYKQDNPKRFFVAVSDWDWGHVLQVHDNIISNWKAGDTYVIPANVFHASANFGIAPKYTLTITGIQ